MNVLKFLFDDELIIIGLKNPYLNKWGLSLKTRRNFESEIKKFVGWNYPALLGSNQ